MDTDEVLGVDIGGVIIDRINDGTDTSFFGDNYLRTTAYSSTPEETDEDPFITASGIWVKDGIVANNLLPFGTKIRLPELYGDKVFVVEDRMNSRKGYYHFDIWFASKKEALQFGAKNTYVEVLGG